MHGTVPFVAADAAGTVSAVKDTEEPVCGRESALSSSAVVAPRDLVSVAILSHCKV